MAYLWPIYQWEVAWAILGVVFIFGETLWPLPAFSWCQNYQDQSQNGLDMAPCVGVGWVWGWSNVTPAPMFCTHVSGSPQWSVMLDFSRFGSWSEQRGALKLSVVQKFKSATSRAAEFEVKKIAGLACCSVAETQGRDTDTQPHCWSVVEQ